MSLITDLLLATNNRKKLIEMRAILQRAVSGKIFCAGDFPEIPEPEETGATFAENARIKAAHYCQHTGLPALADDSGLVVDALNGRPGVHSARYAPTDDERIARLLSELAGVADANRTARFACAIALARPDGTFTETEGTLEGHIGHSPTGTHGFGYDPIFLVAGTEKTLAELLPDEKNSISHRAQALQKLNTLLHQHI